MLKRFSTLMLTFAFLLSVLSFFPSTVSAALNKPEYKGIIDLSLNTVFATEKAITRDPEYKYVAVFISDEIWQSSTNGGPSVPERKIRVWTMFAKKPVIKPGDDILFGHHWLPESFLEIFDIAAINGWDGWEEKLLSVGKKKDIDLNAAAARWNPEYMSFEFERFDGSAQPVQYYVADRSTAAFYNKDTIPLVYTHIINVGAVDTSRLTALIGEAKTLQENSYLPASWANLQTVLSKAEAQLQLGVHGQKLVDKLCKELQSAVDALVATSNSITTFKVGTYEAAINQTNKTLTFALPHTALAGNKLVDNITALDADGGSLGFEIDGTIHKPFSLGSSVGFKDGDKVFAKNGEKYTIVFNMQTAPSKDIRAFTVGSHASVVNQTDKTVTFSVPNEALVGNKLVGNITALDADGGSLGFKIDGTTHKPFSLGSSVGFKDGDEVFAADSSVYTIRITSQAPVGNRINSFSVGGYAGAIDEGAKTINFSVPASAMLPDGRFAGNISALTTESSDSALTFGVWGGEYAGYKQGDQVGFHNLSEVYTSAQHKYVIKITII